MCMYILCTMYIHRYVIDTYVWIYVCSTEDAYEMKFSIRSTAATGRTFSLGEQRINIYRRKKKLTLTKTETQTSSAFLRSARELRTFATFRF